MKTIRLYIVFLLTLVFATSCDKDLKFTNTVDKNFNMLWKEIDEKYCFFEYKKDSIKDWNAVYDEYYPKAINCETTDELFDVFSDMLNELKDGHVNIYSSFDVSGYDIRKGTKYGYSIELLTQSTKFLKNNSRRCGGFYYRTFNEGSIGYAFYPNFSNRFSETNLDNIFTYFKDTKGMILDMRGNGGGYVYLVNMLASRFTEEEVLVGYSSYKTGKGHNDFSEPKAKYLAPSEHIRYDKPVVVLTDRGCYSATNDFVQTVKGLKNVTIVGDQTGGGSGLPVSSELPIGWVFRMSANPMYDKEMKITEFGIEPDVKVIFDKEMAVSQERDNVVEKAIEIINSK